MSLTQEQKDLHIRCNPIETLKYLQEHKDGKGVWSQLNRSFKNLDEYNKVAQGFAKESPDTNEDQPARFGIRLSQTGERISDKKLLDLLNKSINTEDVKIFNSYNYSVHCDPDNYGDIPNGVYLLAENNDVYKLNMSFREFVDLGDQVDQVEQVDDATEILGQVFAVYNFHIDNIA